MYLVLRHRTFLCRMCCRVTLDSLTSVERDDNALADLHPDPVVLLVRRHDVREHRTDAHRYVYHARR